MIAWLNKYRVGVIGGMFYSVIAFLAFYIFEICTNTDGACIVLVAPTIFHADLLQRISESLAQPFVVFIINTIIFTFEGVFIEFLVRKTNL